MDLKAEILYEHSKAQALKIVEYVGDDPERFEALMEQFFHGGTRITQRAAYPMMKIAEKHIELFHPYCAKMLDFMQGDVHVAVVRNTLRTFSLIDLPEELLGTAADLCFELLEKGDSAIAVKVFSMSTLYRICLRVPELKNELKMVIEVQMPMGSSGFVSRGKKILNGLEKIKG